MELAILHTQGGIQNFGELRFSALRRRYFQCSGKRIVGYRSSDADTILFLDNPSDKIKESFLSEAKEIFVIQTFLPNKNNSNRPRMRFQIVFAYRNHNDKAIKWVYSSEKNRAETEEDFNNAIRTFNIQQKGLLAVPALMLLMFFPLIIAAIFIPGLRDSLKRDFRPNLLEELHFPSQEELNVFINSST